MFDSIGSVMKENVTDQISAKTNEKIDDLKSSIKKEIEARINALEEKVTQPIDEKFDLIIKEITDIRNAITEEIKEQTSLVSDEMNKKVDELFEPLAL